MTSGIRISPRPFLNLERRCRTTARVSNDFLRTCLRTSRADYVRTCRTGPCHRTTSSAVGDVSYVRKRSSLVHSTTTCTFFIALFLRITVLALSCSSPSQYTTPCLATWVYFLIRVPITHVPHYVPSAFERPDKQFWRTLRAQSVSPAPHFIYFQASVLQLTCLSGIHTLALSGIPT